MYFFALFMFSPQASGVQASILHLETTLYILRQFLKTFRTIPPGVSVQNRIRMQGLWE